MPPPGVMGTAGPLSAFDRPVRFEGEEEVVKRIRVFTVLGILAVVLPIGLLQGVAKADGGVKSVRVRAPERGRLVVFLTSGGARVAAVAVYSLGSNRSDAELMQ